MGIYLRPPQPQDCAPWCALREASRAFLSPWEPVWPADDLNPSAFRSRLRRYARDIARDDAYPFLLFRQKDDALLGGLTLSNVRRGACQTASLGYWMGAPYAGQGYMTAAVRALAPVAHQALRLHRIEAACMPTNRASIRVLTECGFVNEGYSRQYLRINGRWEDHLLFARLRQDALAPNPVRLKLVERS
ncbi:GNAT family N-acetyltransferase [Xanthobacter sp. TB0139]|uniref:GNAT family N-acetyltransferase n=1 Tax=Xanthobacter sp. TB0139 TaxID=3459178 RepID=UPI00403991BA